MAVSPTIILAIIGGVIALFAIILICLLIYLVCLKNRNKAKEDEYNKVPRKSVGNGVSMTKRTIEQANRKHATENGFANPMYETRISPEVEPVLRNEGEPKPQSRDSGYPEHRNPPPYVVETIPGGSRVIISGTGSELGSEVVEGTQTSPDTQDQVVVVTNQFTTHAPPQGQRSNPESEISSTTPTTDDRAGIIANEYPTRNYSKKSAAESYVRPVGYVHLNTGEELNEAKIRGDWGPLNMRETQDWSAQSSEIGGNKNNWGQLSTLERQNSARGDYPATNPTNQDTNWGQLNTIDRQNSKRGEYANTPTYQNTGPQQNTDNYGQLNTIERQNNATYQNAGQRPETSLDRQKTYQNVGQRTETGLDRQKTYQNVGQRSEIDNQGQLNAGSSNVVYQNSKVMMEPQDNGVLIHID